MENKPQFPRIQYRWITPVCVIIFGACAVPVPADVPFSIKGAGVDPADFQQTVFATGLNYPVGMTQLADQSILVAVSNGPILFGSNSGSLIRLADVDGDGVSDSRTTLVNNVPGGLLTSVRAIGDLVLVTGQGRPITVFRTGEKPTDRLTAVGASKSTTADRGCIRIQHWQFGQRRHHKFTNSSSSSGPKRTRR